MSKSLESNYNFIKGRIAEAIIERLFISLNMIPMHNGYEIKHPDMAHLRRTGQLAEETIKRIEFGCDFLIRSTDKNETGQYEVYQIEVKFSKEGRADLKRLEVYDNEKMIFIFINFDGFWCATKQEINILALEAELKKVNFSQLTRLEDHHVFAFSESQKEIIKRFVHFINATLGEIKDNKELKKNMYDA